MRDLVLASLIAAASYFIFWLPVFSKKFFKLAWEDRARRTIFWYSLYWIAPLILVGMGLLSLEALGVRFNNILVSILFGKGWALDIGADEFTSNHPELFEK